MKFLYFTDLHLRLTAPISRRDDYFQAILRKVLEIDRLRVQHQVDYVLFGGDLFDGANPQLEAFFEIWDRIKGWKCYTNVGSHDYRGYQESTIPRTGVGFLERVGAMCVVKQGIVLEKDGVKVRLVGCAHTTEQTAESLSLHKGSEDFLIQLIHGDIVDKKVIWEHILISDIKTEADLVLVGHYHHGWDPIKIGNTTFAHPGSIARTDISEADIEPSVFIFSTEDHLKLHKIKLEVVTPSAEIFVQVEREKSEVSLDAFIESAQALQGVDSAISLSTIIRTIGANHSGNAVRLVLDKVEAHSVESVK